MISFGILTLHPVTLLYNYLPVPIFVHSFRFSTLMTILPLNKDSFISFFLTCIPIVSFCLIAFARTSSTMLIRKGEQDHLCLSMHLGSFMSFHGLTAYFFLALVIIQKLSVSHHFDVSCLDFL